MAKSAGQTGTTATAVFGSVVVVGRTGADVARASVSAVVSVRVSVPSAASARGPELFGRVYSGRLCTFDGRTHGGTKIRARRYGSEACPLGGRIWTGRCAFGGSCFGTGSCGAGPAGSR